MGLAVGCYRNTCALYVDDTTLTLPRISFPLSLIRLLTLNKLLQESLLFFSFSAMPQCQEGHPLLPQHFCSYYNNVPLCGVCDSRAKLMGCAPVYSFHSLCSHPSTSQQGHSANDLLECDLRRAQPYSFSILSLSPTLATSCEFCTLADM